MAMNIIQNCLNEKYCLKFYKFYILLSPKSQAFDR